MKQRQLSAHRGAVHPAVPTSVGKRPDRLSHTALTAARAGHAEEPSDVRAGGFSRVWRRILLPLGCSVGAEIVMITALAVAVHRYPDPTALIFPVSAAALGLSSLVGGITAGKCNGRGAVKGSLFSGCLMAAILCAAALLMSTDRTSAMDWLLRLSPIPWHLIGGLLTRPRKKPSAHTAGTHASRRRSYMTAKGDPL